MNHNNVLTSKAIQSLTKTTEELLIQSEISSFLDSIVSDIESTQTLVHQVNHDRLVAYLTQRCKNAEQALGEYQALEMEQRKERHRLGKELIRELFSLEQQMKKKNNKKKKKNISKETKEKDIPMHTEIIHVNHMEEQEEEEEKEEEEEEPNPEMEEKRTMVTGDIKENPLESNSLESNGVTNLMEEESVVLGNTTKPKTVVTIEISTDTDTDTPTDFTHDQEHVHHDDGSIPISIPHHIPIVDPSIVDIISHPNTEMITKENTDTSQLSSDHSRILSSLSTPNTTTIYLPSLNPKILVCIFEYLDPLEIVHTAQANKRLYSKVNGIFGLEGAVFVEEEDFQEPKKEEEEEVDVMIIEDVEHEGSIQEDISFSTTTLKQNTSKPTIVSIPHRETTKESSHKSNAPPPTSSSSTSKPKISEGKVSSSDSKDFISISTSSTTSSGKASAFQMSAAVAKSLATKLSPVELSAIITMRDQLRQKEEEAHKSFQQLDETSAQLEDALAVNEVLTEETSNLKRMLESVRASAAEITRQSNSDQEVIAFLDERVQELEKTVDNLKKEQKQVDATLEKSKNASERQLTVLTELLTYEREQKADQERDWKYDKKVLVKEVKKCRTQIMSLEAERDGLRQENQKLKEALLSLGVAAGARKKSFDSVYN